MSASKRFEMTQEQLDKILHACRAVPYMIFGGREPTSPQESANHAWDALGREMGFDGMTVESVAGESDRVFMAVPSPKPATCEV